MSVLSNIFGRLTKTVRNVGRRSRKVGRNSARLAGRVAKPVTNAVGLTRRVGRPSKKSRKERQSLRLRQSRKERK